MTRRIALLSSLATLLPAASAEDAAVKKVLDDQTTAWNNGDLKSFVDGYANDAVFVGAEVTRGKAGVLERYQKSYATPEKRGKLEFSELEIKQLGNGYASVIGRFHLTRSAAGGGDAKGIFSLLFHKTKQGWKIALDHTS